MLIALIPPILGNLIIIFSDNWLLSNIGSYIYFIGLDITVCMLLRFTTEYCRFKSFDVKLMRVITIIVAIDIGQLLLNTITGHAFYTTPIIVDGYPYYSLVPLFGQAFHRVVAYGIFFVSIGLFVYKLATSGRIYIERYLVILLCMVLTGAWETFYIVSGSPIDRSMLGFGVFGLLVFYFALYYKPFRLLDSMLSRIVSGLGEAIYFFDSSGVCIYANERGRSMIGLTVDEEILASSNKKIIELIGKWGHGYNTDWSDSRIVTNPDGSSSYYAVRAQQIFDQQGKHMGAALTIRDTTQEELNLRREKHLATHDRLTGLFNQEHLYEEMDRLLNENPYTEYLVVAIDVKDFKIINDIFSKEFGDKVLCGIADKLRYYATPNQVYGRLTGDKFGFMVPVDEFDPDEAEASLRDHSFVGLDVNYPVVIHMGIYEVRERNLRPSVMFDRAHLAISSIKNDFQRHVAVYDKAMRDNAIWKQKISAQLDDAIEEGQIRPYLQPMVNERGIIKGAEMLVRWIHPEEGFLSPARFIPVFEENGMIAKLDTYMWECACKLLKEWEQKGLDLFLSVNISPKDFYFMNVDEVIRGLVEKYKVNASKLRLEITETVMMSDVENRMRILENLRGYGFLVEMDDFGSGYSSLNLLKDMPVDVLKIDMVFLYKTKDQTKAHTILSSIINLSDNLGIPSVTEGVETAEQRDMLLNMGCRLFQGYFFAKPMPVEQFEELYIAA